jgi:hypothetical protein
VVADKARRLEQHIADRFGGADARAGVRRACASLLEDSGVTKPPTRLAPLARRLGAELKYDNALQIGQEEASLRLIDNRLVLWVAKSRFENPQTRQRARFSIAHEVGHLLLFRALGPEFLQHNDVDEKSFALTEGLCDLVASHLLIPRATLAEALRARGFTSQGFNYLRKLFDVSASSLLRAIADLVPLGGIVEWRSYRRHAGEHLAWRVWETYASSASDSHSSWLPVGCTMKHVHHVGEVSVLVPNEPVGRTNITLSLGRLRRHRDAVICLWPATSRQAENRLVQTSSLGKTGPEFEYDESAGRLLMAIGQRGRFDFAQFGVGLR